MLPHACSTIDHVLSRACTTMAIFGISIAITISRNEQALMEGHGRQQSSTRIAEDVTQQMTQRIRALRFGVSKQEHADGMMRCAAAVPDDGLHPKHTCKSRTKLMVHSPQRHLNMKIAARSTVRFLRLGELHLQLAHYQCYIRFYGVLTLFIYMTMYVSFM